MNTNAKEVKSHRLIELDDGANTYFFQPGWFRGVSFEFVNMQRKCKIIDVQAFIRSIYDASSADYIRWNITEKDFPYELMVINNLSRILQMEAWSTSYEQTNIQFKIYKYMEHLFLKHYKPYQLPKLYASILEPILMHDLGAHYGVARKSSIDRFDYFEQMLKYYKMAQHYENTHSWPLPNISNLVSKICFQFEKTNILIGKMNLNCAKALRDDSQFDKAAKYFLQTMKCYVLNDTSYSVCDTYHGIDFIIDIIKFFEQSIIRYDIDNIGDYLYNNNKNKNTKSKRCKRNKNKNTKLQKMDFLLSKEHHLRLLKIIKHLLLKKVSKYIQMLSLPLFCDRYQRIWITLGNIYYRREMKIDKAIECYEKAISYYHQIGVTINSNLIIPYQSLHEIYHALGQWHKCVKYLKLCNDILSNDNYTAPNKMKQIKINHEMIQMYQSNPCDVFVGGTKNRMWTNFREAQDAYNQWYNMIDNQTRLQLIEYMTPFQLKNGPTDKRDTLRVINNMAQLKECNNKKCLKKGGFLMKCKGCRSVFYCSKKCQKIDWKDKKNGHKHCCHWLTSNNIKRNLGGTLQRTHLQ